LPSGFIIKTEVEKFKSEKEAKSYFTKGFSLASSSLDLAAQTFVTLEQERISAPAAGFGKVVPERVSETNVQVKGIDEPDILKTDGQEIYFSSQDGYRLIEPAPMIESGVSPRRVQSTTKVIKAFPPGELAQKTALQKSGQLLLDKKTLLVLADRQISGFDVSNPAAPREKWDLKLGKRNRLVTARLYQGKAYLIFAQTVSLDRPCPFVPLSVAGKELKVRCQEIYHPVSPVATDIVFTALRINPLNGQIEASTNFTGSSSLSVSYMSPQALYITYGYQIDIVEFFYRFLSEAGQDLVSQDLLQKFNRLRAYEISNTSKLTEVQLLLESYYASLGDDEAARVRNEINNKLQNYLQKNQRALQKTGLVKLSLPGLEVQSAGSVPGQPLNQFSLDEYQGNLRIATTIGGRWFGLFGQSESTNDLYILDQALRIKSSIEDLGQGERIYSARFIKDKGYLVTFRQIDPFYVLDLRDPARPTVKGELKIPGYSSYLHPITKDQILGIGKEGSQVKISLFDVSRPEAPTEIDKYTLEEYWSDILNTHHAFLLDSKHQIFFLPGSKGGYIFSYQGNRLELKKVVADTRARRALYIADYLYVVSNDQIVVLNELDWQEVNRLEL
jgi:uncharacterized secreted protein with C-terminal beta-propeller domain